MERKIIKFEIKAVDAEQGVIEGYGATFSDKPDSYGDIIDPGAFTKTLKEHKDSIVSLFNHNVMEPIGLPELMQDKTGLHAKIHLVLDIQKARDTLALARAGVIKRLSIGYDTVKSDFIDGVRHLKEVRLYDVSPVVFAANPQARILSVKAATTFDDLPLADRDKAWDATASERRVRAWAGGDDISFDKYRRAFMWYNSDEPELLGSYKLGFADVVGGRLTAVPRGIFATAGVLMGARGGVSIPAEDKAKVKAHCEKYYAKMRKEFDDESIVAPWESGKEEMIEMELKPYPNEHACRLRNPDDFQEDSFRRISRVSDGKKYSVIMGRLKGEDTMAEQAYRYDKDIWDADEAKSHCEEHDGKFEPASEKQEKSGRVLSAASMGKIRAALEALRALLEAAEIDDEAEKSLHLSDESYEAAELDDIIAGLKASNEGFDAKEAEARIDAILAQIRQ